MRLLEWVDRNGGLLLVAVLGTSLGLLAVTAAAWFLLLFLEHVAR